MEIRISLQHNAESYFALVIFCCAPGNLQRKRVNWGTLALQLYTYPSRFQQALPVDTVKGVFV